MPLLHTYESPVMGIREITEPWQDMLRSLKHNNLYSKEVDKIQSDKRKQEWLAVRLLLQHLCGPDIYIDYRNNGTPFLKGSLLHISISHTKGYAAVILSENKNPGIDIEYRSERAWKLRKKYLSDKETGVFLSLSSYADLNNQNHIESDAGIKHKPNHTDVATIFWCAKETAFKALQQAEVDFIEHLHILPFTLSDEGFLILKETRTPRRQTFIINYKIAEDYIITWKA